MDLGELRKQIDSIDREIVELYERRMEVARKVAIYKIETGKKVFDKEREREKIAQVKTYTQNEIYALGVGELFEQIMSMSRKLQYQILAEHRRETSGREEKLPFLKQPIERKIGASVVFQGADGAYSQAAMMQYFGEQISSFHVDTFRDAMIALEEGSADFAVLPIENSSAGIVSEIYDLLVEFEHYIVGEQIIPISHCLLGIEGTQLEEIQTIYSHPQSLMQSTRFLEAHPQWQQISMANNAFAVQKVVQEGQKSQAAIASEYAGKLYGLEVLKEGVNNNKTNSTRFIIVANQKIFFPEASKVSICFEIPHESGSLYHLLSHFIFNHLNMTKIESRPLGEKNWEYRFFLDFDGNLEESAVKNALRGLREETKNLKILGNY